MAELTFRSPGVSSREVDETGPVTNELSGDPATIISTTPAGPAFVPIAVADDEEYKKIFGAPKTGFKFGPMAAQEWLSTQRSLIQVRVLGVGDGKQKTTAGLNTGRVNMAGFVVGDEQPQTILSGALGNNTYANPLDGGGTVAGMTGRTFFLGCFMSQSANSTLFSDAGLAAQGVPIVRGVIMAASGVLLTLSSSNAGDNSIPSSLDSADTSLMKGFWTGSLNIASGRQEFTMYLNGHKSTAANPNYINASFDPRAPNYFANMFNSDPLKLEETGHLLYASWHIHPALALPTGSGIVTHTLGASGSGNGIERIAFIVTGSATRNSGSTTIPNFENFESRFTHASTPYFISQDFGGTKYNLFRLVNMSAGAAGNETIKVSIENISPSITTAYLYGSFDVVIRRFNDTDTNKVVLQAYRNINLDPSSNRYIGRVIGTENTYYNFDADEQSQKLQTDGLYPLRSDYVRVEISDVVESGEVPMDALPMGFRGPQHLVTSGSAPMGSFRDTSYYSVATDIFQKIVQPPVPFRLNLKKGADSSVRADRNLYWGVQFEQITSATETNANSNPNTSIKSFAKFFPRFQTTWMNMAVRDNEGTADTAANTILDADRFNNNLFSLERIKVKYSASTNKPDLSNLTSWSYVRGGNITTDTVNLYRALTVADLVEPSIRGVAKYTVYFEGGFDGTRIFDQDCARLTNKAAAEELSNTSRGYSDGPTVKSYIKALDIVKDTTELDTQLLIVPGIRTAYLTDSVLTAMSNDRFDCLYIMDVEEKDTANNLVLSDTQNVSVRWTSTNHVNRGINNSFGAAYFPDVMARDLFNNTEEKVPPSVIVLGAFGRNDAIGHPWFAPAGFARGTLASVNSTSIPISQTNMDDLYPANINPIVSFAGRQATINGQKTLLAEPSARNRVNVRRLLIHLRRRVRRVANRIMFEPLRVELLEKFQNLITPIFKEVQDQGGLEGFIIRIDTNETTQADIDNKLIRGKIFVEPTSTLEFMSIDFVFPIRG